MRKLYYIFTSLIMVMVCLAGYLFPAKQAFAATTEVEFDSSYVLDDLKGTIVDGKLFNIINFPKDSSGGLRVVMFAEYCYSYYEGNDKFYTLYVYVYNPRELNINENSSLNKISVATEFNASGNPTKYTKFNIKLCNRSKDDKRFYKFKIVDVGQTILSVMRNYAGLNGNSRAYSVGEIELLNVGNLNVTAYKVGNTYKYSGYADGFGKSDGTSLDLEVAVLETIQLDVHSTFYRPEGESETGEHIQDQLNSVYFAVPNDILRLYGRTLYSAHIEWYEYMTKEIFVVGSKAVNDKLKANIGKNVTSYNNDIYYGFTSALKIITPNYVPGVMLPPYDYVSDYGFNTTSNIVSDNKIEALYYLFGGDNKSAYDYTVDSNQLLDYILKYSKDNNSYGINGKYSSDLFYNKVDSGRTFGYNEHNVGADDEYILSNYVLNQNWFQKFLGIKNYTSNFFEGIKGIKEVTSADVASANKDTVCDRLFIDSADYNDFIAFYLKSSIEDKTVFLLRFAVTDYTSIPVMPIYGSGNGNQFYPLNIVDHKAYMAQQTVFLDFDIIDLTFYKDGVFTVIPVVASPIDIIPAVTPPVNIGGCNMDWERLLSLMLIILLLIILLPVLPHVLSFVSWLIKGIVTIIVFPFKKIFKNKNKKE